MKHARELEAWPVPRKLVTLECRKSVLPHVPSGSDSKMNANQKPHVYELASGEIAVWMEVGGPICLKICNKFKDPVELSEHEAIELAELLTKLAQELRGA